MFVPLIIGAVITTICQGLLNFALWETLGLLTDYVTILLITHDPAVAARACRPEAQAA